MDHTKVYTTDPDSPCQELSVRGLGFVVALLVCSEIDFCVRLQGEQSSCNCNRCWTSRRSRNWWFVGDVNVFGKFGLSHFSGHWDTLWSSNTILSSKTFTFCHLTKTEWLLVVDSVTAAGPPKIVESDFVGYFDGIWPIWATFVISKPLCDLRTVSWVLKPYLRPFNETRVVDWWCNSCCPTKAENDIFL